MAHISPIPQIILGSSWGIWFIFIKFSSFGESPKPSKFKAFKFVCTIPELNWGVNPLRVCCSANWASDACEKKFIGYKKCLLVLKKFIGYKYWCKLVQVGAFYRFYKKVKPVKIYKYSVICTLALIDISHYHLIKSLLLYQLS